MSTFEAVCKQNTSLRYVPIQGLGLVFVAVYQRALKLLYVDELLERVKQEFSQQYKPDQVEETTLCLVFQSATSQGHSLMRLCSSSIRLLRSPSGKCSKMLRIVQICQSTQHSQQRALRLVDICCNT